MNLSDLAALTGKPIHEVEAMLQGSDTISLNLTERRSRTQPTSEGSIVPI
ncbi:MAG: hypothetical protein ABIC95_04940 [archaeon]